VKTSNKNVLEVSGNDEDEEGTIAAGLGHRGLSSTEFGPPSANELESVIDVQAMVIGEWEEYLSLLEKETPRLNVPICRLYT